MIFLEDLGLDKTKKIGITSLLSNITQKPGSHKGGWTRLLKCQLANAGFNNVVILKNGCDLTKFDYIIFDLGAEYSGTLNLFGGLDSKCFYRVQELLDFKGKLFSWRNKLPDLVGCIKSRALNKSTDQKFKDLTLEDLTNLEIKLNQTEVFDHVYKTDKLLIGDSHTPSVWTPEYMIERRDGRTLKGMLENETIAKYMRAFSQKGVHIYHILVHCSSIDIRHHVARDIQPGYVLHKMVRDFCHQIATFGFTTAQICQTVGIEDESRELPKTGYFKGTPFYGDWTTRNHLRNIFNESVILEGGQYGIELLELPKYFFDDSGKMRFECMEVPGSVHTSPEHYRWDLEKNQLRWSFEYDTAQQVKQGMRRLMENQLNES